MTSLGGSATFRSISDLLSRHQIFNINNVASAHDYRIDTTPRDVKDRNVKRTREIGSNTSLAQPRIFYLTLYNTLLFFLWTFIFVVTITEVPKGKHAAFDATSPRIRWIQTLSFIEVVHAAVGLSSLSNPRLSRSFYLPYFPSTHTPERVEYAN
jgi:hypothetical protein